VAVCRALEGRATHAPAHPAQIARGIANALRSLLRPLKVRGAARRCGVFLPSRGEEQRTKKTLIRRRDQAAKNSRPGGGFFSERMRVFLNSNRRRRDFDAQKTRIRAGVFFGGQEG
jgi:hypothetical protein